MSQAVNIPLENFLNDVYLPKKNPSEPKSCLTKQDDRVK